MAGQQRAKRAGVVLQLPEVQEFVAEARERHALMTTRRARRYQRGGLCKSENGEIWYGKYYPAPGAPQKRVQLGRSSEMNERQARTALDDIIAVLNRNPAHALGAEPVRTATSERMPFRRTWPVSQEPSDRPPATRYLPRPRHPGNRISPNHSFPDDNTLGVLSSLRCP
jgi:hypothetical protein